MERVKVKDIKVLDRFRKKYEGIEDLSESMERLGLIEPIVVDENNVLIAGERRLRAARILKWEEIEVKRLSELSEIEKKEIELEENIQRQAFTWQEEVTAKAELHKLKQKIHGAAVRKWGDGTGWGLKQTADALGESIGTVSMDIQLAKGMKAFPELIKEKSKSVAFKKLKKMQERILQEELAKRLKERGVIDRPEIILGDCVEEMGKMKGESVDLILTDPPFGIDIGEAHTFGRMTVSDTYQDGEFETFDLLDKAIREMYRVLKMDRHMFIFCAIEKIPKVKALLEKHGFWVHHMPLIWDKGSGSYPSQSTTFVHSYECFLHCMKGKRMLNGTPKDLFTIKRVPPNKKIHPSEKPTELLRALIEYTTLAGELVLDPFCGSGATIVATKELNRRGVGIEKDRKYHKLCCERLEGGEGSEMVSKM